MVVPSGHGTRLSANFDCTRVLAQRDFATSHAGRLHSLPCQQLVPATHPNLSHDLPASPALHLRSRHILIHTSPSTHRNVWDARIRTSRPGRCPAVVEPCPAHASRPGLLPDLSGRRELIDHVLASAALVRTVDSVHAVVPQPPSVCEQRPHHASRHALSDHAPVVAVFDVLIPVAESGNGVEGLELWRPSVPCLTNVLLRDYFLSS